MDSLAQYPGGRKAWQRFLIKILRYPQKAQDNEIMGETLVAFVVDADGTVSDIHAIMGDPILAEASIRIIRLSGKWMPAINQGRKVKVLHIPPVIYRLETEGPRPRKRK